MSYARFGCDGSNVYIYGDIDGAGIVCAACPFAVGSFIAKDEDEMLAHVERHRAAGHCVPTYVDERLAEEKRAALL